MNEPRRINPGRQNRGGWRLAIIALVILLAIIIIGPLGGLYVDRLWFQSVGLTSVFDTRVFVQTVIFAIAAVAFFLVFVVNGLLATRLAAPRAMLVGSVLRQGPPEISPWLKIAVVVAGLVLALLVGLGFAGSWDIVMRFLNPASFGVADPLFGRDVGFFVFTLPMYEMIHGWVMTTLILTILGVLAVYAVQLILPQLQALERTLEGQVTQLRLDLVLGPGIKAHLAVLVALIALTFSARTVLDIFGLVYSEGGLFFGASFADVHARWPALWLIAAAGVLFAALTLLSIRRRGYGLIALGVGLWIAVAIVGGGIYPGLVQRFQVAPSELDKETPYLSYNINMTNQAYRLDAIDEIDYPAEDAVTPAEIQDNAGTIKNIRLIDPAPLLDTYNQIQSIRLYYDFLDVDVDRYMIDGEYRQVMLSARELDPDKLPSQAQTWVNRRLQFTHGYGVAMSPVNEVTAEGLPQLLMRDVPPQGTLPLTRPEIYYGESTDNVVVVKTSTPEFDYPKGNDNVYVRYEGSSGVPAGSFLRRLLFAWQFGDLNILLTGSISSDSRILYNRNIKERAKLVAPFLTYDADPYVAVADGRLYWILDAYTNSDRYPYSQPVNLREAGRVNYLRNSVKVVQDAYEGSIRFYVSDPNDPLIQSYRAIFPELFTSLDELPSELRSHVRYPEDLFRVQAELYRTYHMKDVRVFYNKEDFWNIASEVRFDQKIPVEPYYVIMRLPGEQKEEFALILPYTPPNKDNMITWLAARSDGDAYGKLVAYKYPKDKLAYGPMQIEARIDQDATISQQLTLWNQSGSRVIRGNLIVIPIGKSNLYVEPIYLQSEQTKLPEMKRVVMATGNRVVMQSSVSEALTSLFAGIAPAAAPQPAPAPAPAPGPAPVQQQLNAVAKALLDRMDKLQTDLKSLQDDLRQLLQSSGSPPSQ